jgi:hypothetical protein
MSEEYEIIIEGTNNDNASRRQNKVAPESIDSRWNNGHGG